MAKDMRMLAAIAVLVLLCAGHASASYRQCYSDCFENCTANKGEVVKCVTKCLFKCLSAQVSGDPDTCDNQCIINQCARFGSDTAQVVDCADTCDAGKCKN